MKIRTKQFRSLSVALKELERFIRDGEHSDRQAIQEFRQQRSRELLANWLLCVTFNAESGDERMTFTTDPDGGDGIICDTKTEQPYPTEHVMARDISDAILAHIFNYAVGFAVVKEGAGSAVLGSGVLVSIEGRRGILTCGHVADVYGNLSEIGLIRFLAGSPQRPQRRMLKLGDTQTIVIQSSDTFEESKEVLDLAFTQVAPDAASSIESQGGVFLNIEKEPGEDGIRGTRRREAR